jgi:fibrillarin-like pre-rRNA processing protein
MTHTFPNLILKRGKFVTLWTKNAYPGHTHFEERTITVDGAEYRELSPMRSKLAAGIANGIGQIGFKEGSIVLYLGASHGYTPSFVSDIISRNGTVFAIDVAPRVVRDLYFLAEERTNIIPILEDCNHPERYAPLVTAVDVVYQDIAQRNQVEIFRKNLRFLKKGGFGILALKSRSIDVAKRPQAIYREVQAELERLGMIVDKRELDPHEKDHCLFIIKI